MGSVEHVGGGGEIRLNRDKSVHNPDVPGIGMFTLEGLKEFVIEAELANVHPKQGVWFIYIDGTRRVNYIYFPTEGHVDYSEPKQAALERYPSSAVYTALFIGFICGIIVAGILFGG